MSDQVRHTMDPDDVFVDVLLQFEDIPRQSVVCLFVCLMHVHTASVFDSVMTHVTARQSVACGVD